MTPDIDLSRFADAHAQDFERASSEIEAGRKRSHWMWYVFPQVAGLGGSAMSRRYAIESVTEAEAFLTDPVLGANYLRIVDGVWRQVVKEDITIAALFGFPDDAKLVSSLTLFAGVARRLHPLPPALTTFITQADEILQAATAQGLDRCVVTERFLGHPSDR